MNGYHIKYLHLGLMVITAMILSILPLPPMLQWVRPSWILLLLLYLQSFNTGMLRVSFIFLCGLCLDVLQFCYLGEHALALLVIYLIMKNRERRVYFFSLLQQMIGVAVLSSLYHTILVLCDYFSGYNTHFLYTVIGGSIVNALVWPWICFILDKFCMTYRKN